MTFRNSMRAIFLLIGAALVTGLYLTLDLLVVGDLSSLDETTARIRLERSVIAYERELTTLDETSRNWPSSSDHQPSLLLVMDQAGQVISACPADSARQLLQPNQFAEILRKRNLIARPVRGLLSYKGNPVALALTPGLGPDAHTICAVEYLEHILTRESASSSPQVISEEANWPVEYTSRPTREVVLIQHDERLLSGFLALDDVFDQTIALLQVDTPRTHYLGGLETRNHTVLLIGVFILLAGLLTAGAIQRTILSPINYLSHALARVAHPGRSHDPIHVSGSDVVVQLADQVNAMLSRIRQSESDLIRTERMRVAGELSAGVSHNLNNILTGILGPAEYLEQHLEDPETLVEARRIHRAAIRARDLISRFSQAVRHGTPIRTRAIEVNPIVLQAVKASRPRWQDETQARGVQIAVETDLRAALPIQGTSDELYDVLVNLLLNATDALTESGTVTIQTVDIDNCVVLRVKDDGIGIDAATGNRVFEPFFTTKPEIGAGLGLAAVHGILTRWDGSIEVSSERGQGAEFILSFARSWESVVTNDQESTADSGRIGRILIAEDDEIVREVLSLSLSAHELVIVEDGQLALDEIRKDRFDVALIDLSLPYVPGDRIARTIHQVDPKVVTVLMTGWDLSEDDPRRVPFDDHIPKPIGSREDLQEVVARSLQVYDARKLRE